ncbi:MAG: prolipoprotein diacylglyceryl transferase [Opitutales bacterium]|nr:prolipoprotein diacylglyceryl transferase [Opitutales bacterium]
MTVLAYWVHDLSPFLIRFPEGLEKAIHLPGIRWYGMAYLAGFVTAYLLLRRYHTKGRSPYEGEQILNLMTFLILGVLVGGRLGFFLFYKFENLLTDPLIIFRVWEGGMASHGGLVGVFVALVWYSRITRQSVLAVGDIVVTVSPPGIFFGRIANFINGELYGEKTEQVPWACKFPSEIREWNLNDPDVAVRHHDLFSKLSEFGVTTYGQAVVAIQAGHEQVIQTIAPYLSPRHPSQLYAAFLEGLIPFLYLQWRLWRSAPEKLSAGRLSGEFLCLYAVFRIFDEIFREPDAELIAGITRGQFYSIFLLAGGIALIAWIRRKDSTQAP